MAKALVVYSGGLDTTVCIAVVREQGYADIVAVTVDVGQPAADLFQARERAEALGATHVLIDGKDEFARDYCFPALQANASYQGYPLSTAIARPLIAKKAAEEALRLGDVDAIVHGCTGKGNDQFRIEHGLRAVAPEIPILAPIRERDLTREWELEYAERQNLPVGQSREKIWSIDENLWGRSIEGGRLEDPALAPPEEIFQWTSAPEDAPDEPRVVEIEFAGGVPVAIDNRPMEPRQIIAEANRIAGLHGVGRIDMMEDRLIGLKARENYECPGATLLIRAHAELEALVCTRAERRFKATVDAQWAELAYAGLWHDPLKDDLEAFIGAVQRRVTGFVRLVLYKGGLRVTGRRSPWALYREGLASFDDAEQLPQSAMPGMVRVHGLETMLYREVERECQP
jgi:argininosuccinate synthase